MYRDNTKNDEVGRIAPGARHGPSTWAAAQSRSALALVRDPAILPAELEPGSDERSLPSAGKELEPRAKGPPHEVEPVPGSAANVNAGRRRGRLKLFLFAVTAILALGGAGWYGHYWLTVGRFIVSTDDAYVRAHSTTLAAKVSGYLASIDVEDNALVRAGDVIARIDDGDYQLAVASARDKVATQEATVARLGRQIVAQQANVEQARAQLASMQAARKQADSEFERQQSLAAKDFASRQTLERALASRDQAVAAVESARAGLDAAQANVDVLKAQQQEAVRTLEELRTALARAERDLSFTLLRAPICVRQSRRPDRRLRAARAAAREPGSAPRSVHRGELQGDAACAVAAGAAGRRQYRCAIRRERTRHHRKHVAGIGLGVLAAAAR